MQNLAMQCLKLLSHFFKTNYETLFICKLKWKFNQSLSSYAVFFIKKRTWLEPWFFLALRVAWWQLFECQNRCREAQLITFCDCDTTIFGMLGIASLYLFDGSLVQCNSCYETWFIHTCLLLWFTSYYYLVKGFLKKNTIITMLFHLCTRTRAWSTPQVSSLLWVLWQQTKTCQISPRTHKQHSSKDWTGAMECSSRWHVCGFSTFCSSQEREKIPHVAFAKPTTCTVFINILSNTVPVHNVWYEQWSLI